MIGPCPVCVTCGTVLGNVAHIFRCELMNKIEEVKKGRNIKVTKILTDPTIEIDLSDLLEKLAVTSDCCKKDLVTAMNIQDYLV